MFQRIKQRPQRSKTKRQYKIKWLFLGQARKHTNKEEKIKCKRVNCTMRKNAVKKNYERERSKWLDINASRQGLRWEKEKDCKRFKRTFGGKKLSHILIMIGVTGLFTFVTTYQTVHFNRVNFSNVNYGSITLTFLNGMH